MNNAQIDVLLQLPVPRPESAPSASRARDDAPAFDNHFRQASEEGAQTPSSPAPPTRVVAADRDDAQQSPPNSTPSPESTAAAEDAAPTADQRDADDAEQAETAEAAGVLAPAEQATQANGSEAAADADADADAESTSSHSDPPERTRAQPAAKAHGKPTAVNQDATPAASEADVDAQAAAPRSGRTGAAELNVTAAAAENASADSLEPQPTSAQENDGSPRVAAKSHSGERGPIDKTVVEKASQQQAVAQSAAAVHSGEHAAASTTENRKAAADDAPKKSDKKSAARTAAAPSDPTATPNERPAAVARSADAPATAPATANVQPQLPFVGTTRSASADSTIKPKDASAGVKDGLLSPFARFERSNAGGAHGSRRAARGDGSPHVDPARFVSRVARAIHTAQERGGPLQLRLSPPELGAMRLEISVNQGALTATIETDNSTARQLLLDNLPALRDRLAEQNVKIERFDVDVRRDTSGNGQPNPGPQEHGQHQRHESTPDRHGAARRAAAQPAVEETSPLRRAITNTSINVVA